MKVTANITMAYIINYMNRYCSVSLEKAFCDFAASKTFVGLMYLKSRICLEIAPEVLFMYADECGLELNEDDFDSFNDAYDIPDKLQYTVNMSEAYREFKGISTKEYGAYLKSHRLWPLIYDNYNTLSSFNKSDFLAKLDELNK